MKSSLEPNTGHSELGRIFDIQRFSVHDGPGIRTTVFMKGCPLRCLWCHNPEGISTSTHLSYTPNSCIGCAACTRVCPEDAHEIDSDGRHALKRDRCVVCGRCVEECFSGALELVGREVSVAQVMDEVLRDRDFYETSGGGLTLSGGEPLAQIAFTEALLARARGEKVHTAVETCGHASEDHVLRIRELVDLFLYDLKETDGRRHREYTGVSNARILGNLKALHDAGAKIVLRLPIVPGMNDREDHFEAIAALTDALPDLCGVEIMPYHKLGASKSDRMGIAAVGQKSWRTPETEEVAGWKASLERRGVCLVQQ